MALSVVGIVRGMSHVYASQLESVEIHVRKRDVQGLPLVDGENAEIRLYVNNAIYKGTARATPNLDVIWISPKVYTSTGRRLTLAEVLHDAGIKKNDRVNIDISGQEWVIRKRPMSNEALLSVIDSLPEELASRAELTTQALADIDDANDELQGEKSTTRTALIEARIGQGQFRNDLFGSWQDACAVTSCTTPEVLVASHIKPWRLSSNQERLDPYNGLLLVSTLDRLFDSGLISFNDTGELLVSDHIDPAERNALGIDRPLRLRQIRPEHAKYLKWHRETLFRGEVRE